MENEDEMIEKYEDTLTAMKLHIEILRGQLRNSDKYPEVQENNFEDEYIAKFYEKIRQLNNEILIEKECNRKLRAEKEWLMSKDKQCKELKEKLEVMKDSIKLLEARNKKLKKSSLIENKDKSSKNSNLLKRIAQKEEEFKYLKETLENLENERNQLRVNYSEITQNINSDEKLKNFQRELEKSIQETEHSINNLKINLKSSQDELAKMSIKPKFSEEFESLISKHERLDDELSSIINARQSQESELEMIETQISEENKNLPSLTLAEVNKNLKNQIKETEEVVRLKSIELINKEKEVLLTRLKFNELIKTARVSNKVFKFIKLIKPETNTAKLGNSQSQQIKLRRNSVETKNDNPNISSKARAVVASSKTARSSTNILSANNSFKSLTSKIVENNRGQFLAALNKKQAK